MKQTSNQKQITQDIIIHDDESQKARLVSNRTSANIVHLSKNQLEVRSFINELILKN